VARRREIDRRPSRRISAPASGALGGDGSSLDQSNPNAGSPGIAP
jgi:hypothetical protein